MAGRVNLNLKEITMRKQLATSAVVGAALCGFLVLSARNQTEAADEGSLLAHDVFFALKDNSADAKTKMVAACKKYLSKHPGEVFFATGTRAEELNRPVNDRDFDVALHIVFKNKEAHDQYQDATRHKQFIEENQRNWAKVRVFDSLVEK
jgi:Stress responsive A/B Barrel Domain